MRDHARFLVVFFLPLVLAMPLAAANYLFLSHTGELTPIEEVISVQEATGALYGTAIHPNVYPYKLDLYAARRPAVVAIGSSRVLQIRQRYFKAPFVNVGRTVNYPAELSKFLDDMLAIAKPEIALVGLDYWWFNPSSVFAFTFDTHRMRGGDLTADALLAPTKWLWSDKISSRFFVDAVTNGFPLDVGSQPMLGLQALVRGKGFGPDGSNYYLGTIYGRGPVEDPKFRETLSRIANKTAQFRSASDPDSERLETVFEAVERLEKAGVKVITFMAPIAPTAIDALQESPDGYRYIDEVRKQLALRLPHHFDFHDPRTIGATDCEFVDGFHAGDVVFARMLDAMATDPRTGLAAYLDAETVRDAAENFRGRALADERYRMNGERELDFLEIGCDKTGLRRAAARPASGSKNSYVLDENVKIK